MTIPTYSHTLTYCKSMTFQTRYPSIPTSPFQTTSYHLNATPVSLLFPFLSSSANPSTTFSVPFFFYLNPNTHQLPLTSSIHPHTTSTHHCPISPTTHQPPLASSALLPPTQSTRPQPLPATYPPHLSSFLKPCPCHPSPLVTANHRPLTVTCRCPSTNQPPPSLPDHFYTPSTLPRLTRTIRPPRHAAGPKGRRTVG